MFLPINSTLAVQRCCGDIGWNGDIEWRHNGMECVRKGKKRSFHLNMGKLKIIFLQSKVENCKNFKSFLKSFFLDFKLDHKVFQNCS